MNQVCNLKPLMHQNNSHDAFMCMVLQVHTSNMKNLIEYAF